MRLTQSNTLLIVTTLAVSGFIAGTIYVAFRFWETRKVDPLPIVAPGQTSEQPTDPGRAFIQVVAASAEAARGSTYTVIVDSNEWSKCTVDVYDPAERHQEYSKEERNLVSISPGRFSWTWNIQATATPGKWLLRFLCGSYENLTTRDHAVEVE